MVDTDTKTGKIIISMMVLLQIISTTGKNMKAENTVFI
jgi:hypothetical protein